MRGTITLHALVVLVALLCFFASSALAGGAPAERWRTIVTPHFQVHYHEQTASIAEDVAEMCEQAHALLAPRFGHEPRLRTQVVLVDESDAANGSAALNPRAVMTLLAAPPESSDTRTDTDHWMWELIVHEYAHILHIDQVRGLPVLVNIPFGRRYVPNQLLPRWFLEGVATALESEHTGGGRVRSNFYEMYLRTAFAEDTVPTLGQLSGVPPQFPYATGWYLFGSDFVRHIAERFGWPALYEMFRRQSRRLRPYAVNYMALDALGVTFDELYADWSAEAAARAAAEISVQRAMGLIEPERLTDDGYFTRWIAHDPVSGAVRWIRADGEDDAAIVSEVAPDDRRLDLASNRDFALMPGGERAVVVQRTRYQGFFSRDDLWFVDLSTNQRTRITRGIRAREPSVAPNGSRVAYSRIIDGRSHIEILDLNTNETERVVEVDAWELASQPQWMPDGRHLLFSMLRINLGRDLFVLDTETGAIEQLSADRAIDDFPYPSPDGNWVYYASDRDGFFNIYALDLQSGESWRVTRVTTGVFNPVVVQRDGRCSLMMSRYSSSGFDIARMELKPDCSPQLVDREPAPASYSRISPLRPGVEAQAEDRRYRTGILARPFRWQPIIERNGRYGQYGLDLGGSDPAGRFSWTLAASIGEPDGQPRWGAEFVLRQLWPDIRLFTRRSVDYRPSSLLTGSRIVPFDEEVIVAGGALSFPFGGFRLNQEISIGYEYERRGYLNDVDRRAEPGDFTPIEPEFGNFSSLVIGWSASTLRSYVRSISPERGFAIGASMRLRSSLLGSDYETRAFSVNMLWAAPIHRFSKHAVAFRLNTGVIRTDYRFRPGYSVGGPSEQNLVDALTSLVPQGTSNVRGYDPGIRGGEQFALFSAEYRFPLTFIDYGHSTLPLFFERLHGAVFVDAGYAFTRDFSPFEDGLLSFGAEVRFNALSGYFEPLGFRAGVARGLGRDGRTQFYIYYGGGF